MDLSGPGMYHLDLTSAYGTPQLPFGDDRVLVSDKPPCSGLRLRLHLLSSPGPALASPGLH
jgi:hypothetical protein